MTSSTFFVKEMIIKELHVRLKTFHSKNKVWELPKYLIEALGIQIAPFAEDIVKELINLFIEHESTEAVTVAQAIVTVGEAIVEDWWLFYDFMEMMSDKYFHRLKISREEGEFEHDASSYIHILVQFFALVASRKESVSSLWGIYPKLIKIYSRLVFNDSLQEKTIGTQQSIIHIISHMIYTDIAEFLDNDGSVDKILNFLRKHRDDEEIHQVLNHLYTAIRFEM